MFRNELQRVGVEGAKVLRLLGNKVETMEKLGAGARDVLREVHEAAEELQKKIDHRSYLLVNSESWEIGRQPIVDDHEQGDDQQEQEQNISKGQNESGFHKLVFKSLSETVLNLSSLQMPQKPAPLISHDQTTEEGVLTKQTSWPSQLSFGNGYAGNDMNESKTYESASALSLATFASLLIEFVARLQNVVDSFEELSVKADFKDPLVSTSPITINGSGFWERLFSCFSSKTRDLV